MDDTKLIIEVEKYRELYDPQHAFYKDNGKKNKRWDSVAKAVGATMEDCKRRWKQLRDSFVKSRNKPVQSGSAGGSVKEWKYHHIMAFLLPHVQPRGSKSSVQLADLEEGTPVKLGCEEDEVVAAASGQASRPVTPLSLTPQSTSSSPHLRGRGLSSRSVQPTQTSRKKSRGFASAIAAEQQLLQILTAEKAPVSPHVPNDVEGMYFFTLSLVPRLNRLSRRSQAQAQIHILQYLTDLEQREHNKLTHAAAASPSATCPLQPQTTQPQTSAFQAVPMSHMDLQGHTPPTTTYQGPAQPTVAHQQQGHGYHGTQQGMLEEPENTPSPKEIPTF